MKRNPILNQFLKKSLLWLLAIVAINAASGLARSVGASYLGRITEVLESRQMESMWQLVLVGGVIMASSYFLRWAGAIACEYLVQKLSLETRVRMVEHLKKISFLKYESFVPGDLQSIFRNDIDTASQIVYILFSRVLNNVFLFVFSIVYMAQINLPMTGIVVVIVLGTAILNQQLLKRMKKHYKSIVESRGALSALVESTHASMDTIKTYWATDYIRSRFARERKALNGHYMSWQKVDTGRLSITNTVNNLLLYGSMMLLGYLGIQGDLSVGQVVTYVYLVKQVMVPVEVIFRWMARLVSSYASWDRVYGLLNLPEAAQAPQESPGPLHKAAAEHITFAYPEASPILSDVSLHMEQGSITGLRGQSGSGKTTLLKILLGQYHSDTAEFTLDDRKADSFLGAAAFASSADALFPMSIHENIALGNPAVTRERCLEIIRLLGFGDWIASLPDGIDSALDEKGLSGGQQQMITNARALLSDAPILILDEPFAALDGEREALLEAELLRQKEHRLLLFTSHRPKSLELCEHVVSL